jgi:protein-tyrosine phosphatase
MWARYDQLLDSVHLAIDDPGPPPIKARSSNAKIRILFVCWGNVCRSPMAEGFFQELLAERNLLEVIAVDSAGISDHNVGKRPHWRARQCMRKRGINISNRRARQFASSDFDVFDRIIVMDHSNLNDLQRMTRNESDRRKVHLLLDYVPGANVGDIPDPWAKNAEYFETVCDLIEHGCLCLLEDITRM